MIPFHEIPNQVYHSLILNGITVGVHQFLMEVYSCYLHPRGKYHYYQRYTPLCHGSTSHPLLVEHSSDAISIALIPLRFNRACSGFGFLVPYSRKQQLAWPDPVRSRPNIQPDLSDCLQRQSGYHSPPRGMCEKPRIPLSRSYSQVPTPKVSGSGRSHYPLSLDLVRNANYLPKHRRESCSCQSR